jgi:hypothetical protein
MANKQTNNARTTPPTIPNAMGNVFEEESFDVMGEVPFPRGAWAATVEGFAPEEEGDTGGLKLVLKKGAISYRTLQLPSSA